MSLAAQALPHATSAQANVWFAEVRARLEQLVLAPYLGPGVSKAGAVPKDYDQLADFFSRKVALPKRARGNPWASAQYIESQKHRSTVSRLMADAFGAAPVPSALQRHLAALPLPLIVDTWYDGALRAALRDRTDWAELQGITRAGIGESRWYRAYDAAGAELALDQLGAPTTLLYTPHGSVAPAHNFLISDADYVEVLTEIDIQSPIPSLVMARRAGLGFLYLGCRFHDQMLRIYARQIGKRSSGPHFAMVDPALGMTRNEARLFSELQVNVLTYPWNEGFQRLIEG